MTANEDFAAVLRIIGAGQVRESEVQAATGWGWQRVHEVLEAMRTAMQARPVSTRGAADRRWIAVDTVIARCPWTPEQVLAEIRVRPSTSRELAAVAQCEPEPMRLLLRRMEHGKQIKTKANNGLRCWIPYEQKVLNGGERKPVSARTLLRLIAEHQPARLELLAELTGRGRVYLRERVHKLRRAGRVKILGVDGSWLYVLPDYERGPKELERDILLRCEDVGGDCLRWDGAHNKQGHPLVRHDGNVRRVDLVLWVAVHGKKIKPGHTLVTTCETPGCCNHAHHEQVTRSEAMRRAFAALGIGGETHGRKVAQAVRSKIGIFTEEQVALIRTSAKSDSALAKELNCCKSTVGSARRHETYRDYGAPFRGLGARA